MREESHLPTEERASAVVNAISSDVATLGGARISLQAHRMPGALVTLSGVDGSGKTTTLNVLTTYLACQNVPFCVIKMPSAECRDLSWFRAYAADWAHGRRGGIDLTALCLICLGDRLMTMRTRVLPLLCKGLWVLCERYVYTPLVEALALGVSGTDMELIRHAVSHFPAPDLAILTTVPPEEAIRRIRSRPEESGMPIDPDLFGKVVDAFLAVAENQRMTVIPTMGGIDCVRSRLRLHLDELIQRRQYVLGHLRSANA